MRRAPGAVRRLGYRPAMVAPFSFFWHDYETFGRVPRRDRPAQFAGVRTDAELREIGDPVMLHCQPPTDMLPDPEACLLTGILPQECQAKGLPEHAFAAALEAVAGPAVRARVRAQRDERIAGIVANWPRGVVTPRAQALGLKADASFEDIIREYIADCRADNPAALAGLG